MFLCGALTSQAVRHGAARPHSSSSSSICDKLHYAASTAAAAAAALPSFTSANDVLKQTRKHRS